MITIEFDEFVTLKSPSQNVLITPPLTKEPEFVLRGKTLEIEFNTLLDPQTTYVINFGNSIRDLNEGNILEDYKYIFSTGAYLDSLTVSGILRDAYRNEVPENIRVHFYHYEEGEDSIPALELPRYFGSVKEDGSFLITNMKPGKYRVFALADANSNYLYDQPNEVIGFTNPIELTDSTSVSLSAFLPTPPTVVTRFRHESYGLLKAAFNHPVDSVKLTGAEAISPLQLLSPNRDTAYFYFSPTELDTLDVIIESGKFIDTTTIRFKSYPKPKLRVIQSNLTAGFIRPDDSLQCYLNYPIKSIDTAAIKVVRDSTEVPFQCVARGRNLYIKFVKPYGQSFQVSIPDSAIIGFNEVYNDSLGFAVKTKKEIDLGAFILVFSPPDSSNYIVQLIDSKGTVKADKQIIGGNATRIYWGDLNPEKLTLRAIRDINGDGSWTTGSYWKMRQPEPVYYFREAIEIKPNWEIEYEWSEDQFNL